MVRSILSYYYLVLLSYGQATIYILVSNITLVSSTVLNIYPILNKMYAFVSLANKVDSTTLIGSPQSGQGQNVISLRSY